MRGGRLVVVLQAGSRGAAGGLVHGRSATGKSFYFEPLDVVETEQHPAAVGGGRGGGAPPHPQRADRRGAGRPAGSRAHADFLAELDLLQAAVRFAERCDGRLPEIGARHELRLVAARHPLLDPASPTCAPRPWARPGTRGRSSLSTSSSTPPADAGRHRPQRRRQDGVAQDRRHPRPRGPVRPADPRRRRQPGALPLPPGGDRGRRAGPPGRPLHLQRPPAAPQGGLGGGRAGHPRAARRAGLGHRSGGGCGARRSRSSKGCSRSGAWGSSPRISPSSPPPPWRCDGASCAAMEFDPDDRPAHLPAGPRPAGRSEAIALGPPAGAAGRMAGPRRGAPGLRAPRPAPADRRGRTGAPGAGRDPRPAGDGARRTPRSSAAGWPTSGPRWKRSGGRWAGSCKDGAGRLPPRDHPSGCARR